MPIPIHIKWYETRENLEGLQFVHYSRPTTEVSVLAMGRGGLFVTMRDKCEHWKITWKRTEVGRYKYDFEHRGDLGLSDPLKLLLPVLRFSDKWFGSHGQEFNLDRLINNRANQLLRFAMENGIVVPGGTVFVVTREGIKESLVSNSSWSLVMGYSVIEPTPGFQFTPMYSNIPVLRLPKSLTALKEEVRRVSRYERPWVI